MSCEFCNIEKYEKGKNINPDTYGDYPEMNFQTSDNDEKIVMFIEFQDGHRGFEAEYDFNFCPMCGDKIKDFDI